jgi:hypothetical protein
MLLVISNKLSKYLFSALFGILLYYNGLYPAYSQSQRVKEAVDIIVLLCVAGGNQISVREDSNTNRASVSGGSGRSVTINKNDARGLVEGLTNAISQLTAEQANNARDCMKPHLKRILDIVLKDDGNTPPNTTNIQIFWPPSQAPCRLSFKIEIAGKSIIPTGSHTPVLDVPIGTQKWAVVGQVSCVDGNFCNSQFGQSVGVANITQNTTLTFNWNLLPGSPRGSPCEFRIS